MMRQEALELERQGGAIAAAVSKQTQSLGSDAASAPQAQNSAVTPVPKLKVPFGSGQVFKIAPKFPVLTSRVASASISGKQTFNILLPVESKNGIPTTKELMETTIGLAIKNARTLGMGKEEFDSNHEGADGDHNWACHKER